MNSAIREFVDSIVKRIDNSELKLNNIKNRIDLLEEDHFNLRKILKDLHFTNSSDEKPENTK
jgi:hypothetical protein